MCYSQILTISSTASFEANAFEESDEHIILVLMIIVEYIELAAENFVKNKTE